MLTVGMHYGAGSPRDQAVVATTDLSTVVARWDPVPRDSTAYQSEADLERALIAQLEAQNIRYLPIHSEADLLANLRAQLGRLNGITFTDTEWDWFLRNRIEDAEGILAKADRIQNHPDQSLQRDDGTTRNVMLIDKDHLPQNEVQVINQYVADQGTHDNRYDVTILVNGLPMVHVELKRRGVRLREAFNQVERYQRESFWSGCGLFEYVQVFVISNGTYTKYYSNSTRQLHVEETAGHTKAGGAPQSYRFTSFWADQANRPIQDLADFARTFLTKRTLLSVLTRYCVLTSEDEPNLLVMRPYQITACEAIINRINVSENAPRMLGTTDAGGYVWHTTGSGKTLTSFKCAQLATRQTAVDKVLFVVDRCDLDYQTVKEYERFQKGCVTPNESTEALRAQLEDKDARIVVTTVQKLSNFCKRYKAHEVYSRHVAIIFDECHRSQFGDMHKAIRQRFRYYHMFGFTGTPIFAENRHTGGSPDMATTDQLFGQRLHTYTVMDAIRDGNVLPFHYEVHNTVHLRNGVRDQQVYDIDRESIKNDAQRVELVSRFILESFDKYCRRDQTYWLSVGGTQRRVRGFNALLATESITAARMYYEAIRRLQEGSQHPLKVAMVYSFTANGDDQFGEECLDAEGLSKSDRDALDAAIADYNKAFGTQHDTTSKGFAAYYKDLTRRIRNQEVDLTIVVDMLLTGFDAKTLNTLFVDRNLRWHGLIQAFSRTNRILNDKKVAGNVICFRDLTEELDDALALFGSEDAHGIVVLKTFAEYFRQYQDALVKLVAAFPLGKPIVGEEAERDFIQQWGLVLSLRNILAIYDEFTPEVDPLAPRDLQDYQGTYLELYDKWRRTNDAKATDVADDVTFELELARSIEVSIDYILFLVEQKKQAGKPLDREVVADVRRLVSADPEQRSKRDLIVKFLETLDAEVDGSGVRDAWREYATQKRDEERDAIVSEERLREPAADEFIDECLRTGDVPTGGLALSRVLPPMSRFTPDGKRDEVKRRVADRIREFVARFRGVV